MYDRPQIIAGPNGRDACSFIDDTLVFRGTLTEGLVAESDWINDFHFDLVSDSRFPGKIHAGFLSSLNALWPYIQGFRPKVISGHSKGGALALLASWLYREHDPVVITFAAPRVGTGRFAKANGGIIYRYENPNDLVTKIPFFYSSPGEQIIAPASFTSPDGIRANHSIETGYRPWIE